MNKILLETQHLIIKPPSINDLDNWYVLRSDPEVKQYLPVINTQEDMQEKLNHAIKHYEKYHFGMSSVFEKKSGEFIGQAGLFYRDENKPDIEIGYALLKKHWSKGYATELVKALIQWGFENFKLHKIAGVVHEDNKISHRVLEKSGMKNMGKLDQEPNMVKYEIIKLALK